MKKFFIKYFCLFLLINTLTFLSGNADNIGKIGSYPVTDTQIEHLFKNSLKYNSDILYTKVPRGVIISIPDKYFFTANETQLKESGKIILKKISDAIKQISSYCVIEGNSFVFGNEESVKNLEISIIRADTIADYLVQECEIPKEQIRAIGFGRIKPFKDNVSYKYNLDKRIDFVILNYQN